MVALARKFPLLPLALTLFMIRPCSLKIRDCVGEDTLCLRPLNYVTTPGLGVSFTCNGMNIQWSVNGNETLPIQARVSRSHVLPPVSILVLTNLTEAFNMSMIQCTAGGSISDEAQLLIQGLLPAVGNLVVDVNDSIVTLSWTAPFSLNITTENPDISGYCVDVYSPDLIFSQCEISETAFNYTLPSDSDCYTVTLTVTPVNVVGNGSIASRSTSVQPNPAPMTEIPETTQESARSGGACVASLSWMHMVLMMLFMKMVLTITS